VALGRLGRLRRLVGAGLLVTSVAACSGGDDDDGGGPREAPAEVRSGDPITLRVLAGSELADLQPILDEAAAATGVTVELELTGTLEGVQQIVDGSADGKYDALWFSSNRYLALHPEAQARIALENRIMTSPVVLGLAAAKAEALGWDGGADVSWSDIAAAAEQDRFTYGMTNPATSNSGFSAVVGVTAALSGTGAALEQRDIDAVAGELRGFFSAQKLSAGSSGWLADAYVARATGAGPGLKVDGLVNYESVLLSLNDGDTLPEPLTLVYPADGVITADYPLSLLDGTSTAARDGYERLVDHLLTPGVQADIMEQTHRRPASPEVEPDERFGPASLVELPFPAKLDVVDGLIDTWFDRLRRPVRTVYVLDVSGSMEGDRIAGLRSALAGLTGADDTLISRAQQFHSREVITLLPFDQTPHEPEVFTLPENARDQDRAPLRAAVEALAIGGDTAIYDSLIRAYDLLDAGGGAGSGSAGDFATSIVLMTDGENNTGAGYDAFVAHHAELPEPLRTVPVFTVLFGEANVDQMERVARLTGGRSFDARSGDLRAAFQEIRGYQ
jgi:Ca-activated chloride channel family protein